MRGNQRSASPWRSVGFGVGAVGGPAAVSLVHPVTGQILAGAEVTMLLVVLTTALFGSQTVSDRAFRLLRWMANRPEPAAPVRVAARSRKDP